MSHMLLASVSLFGPSPSVELHIREIHEGECNLTEAVVSTEHDAAD